MAGAPDGQAHGMRFIPPSIDPETPSEGEKRVFELLASDSAHPGWTVLHSLDIARHRRQMEGEIDFLVVAPELGALVLEVKGCRRLRREHGVWYYGDDAEGHARSPFRQASEAMHSLRRRLVKHRPDLAGVLFQSAVCFPFIDVRDESEEWHPWQVVDRARLEERPIGECLASVLRQARERAAALREPWFDAAAGEPTPARCREIVEALRPDFEFYESPKARAKRIDEEIRHYTEQQFEALDHMRRMPRVIFDGPAGTGKTLLALEAARRSHAAGKSVLLLCFNRALGEWLRDQTIELFNPGGAPTVVARTLHRHLRVVARDASEVEPEGSRTYWEQTLPQEAWSRLVDELAAVEEAERQNPGINAGPAHGIFDVLIVDEAQDILRDCYLDALDLSVRGGFERGAWRMFGDFAGQTIYEDHVDLDAFCDSRGAGCVQVPLDENCRNTPRVADLACRWGGDGIGYSRILRPDDGVEPEIRFFVDLDDERRQLVRVLAELYDAGFTGPQVAVLSMHSDRRSVAASLTEAPWRDRLEPLCDEKDESRVNLHGGKTHYCSIYRFKGLEARAVVLTDIDGLSPRGRSLVYVGATRARQRLVVLADEKLRASLKQAALR
jgi:hypothetical protein